ncbi:MAG TPA: hypothetical protein VN873_01150 [Candidatus Angelobacter sp.]|nr:hypothetical protein [Candidatus Angelobacter sp.]
MSTRNGKIARLPKQIRDELNRRLENGGTGPQLIEWLNSLPKVKRVLRDLFNSQPINEENLSHWRKGGYADWVRHQETIDQTRWMVERSNGIYSNPAGSLPCDYLVHIAVAELAQYAAQLHEIEDPKERWKQFREFTRELCRLQNGAHYGSHVNLDWTRWRRLVDQEEAELAAQQKKPMSQEEYLERLMDLLHKPDIRAWVRTDFPDRETEWLRLKAIYHLKPDSKDTPDHPSQSSREGIRRSAVYEYPPKST